MAPSSPTTVEEVCIPDISPRERLKRLTGGVIIFVISLLILVILITTGTSRWWRLVLFPLFVGAPRVFFQ